MATACSGFARSEVHIQQSAAFFWPYRQIVDRGIEWAVLRNQGWSVTSPGSVAVVRAGGTDRAGRADTGKRVTQFLTFEQHA